MRSTEPLTGAGSGAHAEAHTGAHTGAHIDAQDDGRWVVRLRTAAGALQQYTCASRPEAERFAALFQPRPERSRHPRGAHAARR